MKWHPAEALRRYSVPQEWVFVQNRQLAAEGTSSLVQLGQRIIACFSKIEKLIHKRKYNQLDFRQKAFIPQPEVVLHRAAVSALLSIY